jgi:hypothetical protein
MARSQLPPALRRLLRTWKPGRVDSKSARPGCFFSGVTCRAARAGALALALSLACVSDGVSPHPKLAAVWKSYQKLPAVRALAIAGDPRRDRWISAASGGHAELSEAVEGALIGCRSRRAARRMRAACVLYAVEDEIVWEAP